MGIREIVITSPAPMTDERREQVARLSQLPAKIRILPPLADIAAGHYLVSSVRDIDIDDLLGRSEVAPDPDLLRAAVSGRTILVTGAAGSIGQAVCRIIMQYRPAKLVLLDLNEHGLYQINRELAQQGPTPVVPVLGSATNRKLLGRLLKESGVEVIFHCAAYKHVRLVEENMLEGISNNDNGTWELAEAAYEAGVDRFVLIRRTRRAAGERHGRHQALVRAHPATFQREAGARGPAPGVLLRASATWSGPAARWCRCSRSRSPRAPGDGDARRHDSLLHVGARGRRADRAGLRAFGERRHPAP